MVVVICIVDSVVVVVVTNAVSPQSRSCLDYLILPIDAVQYNDWSIRDW